MEPKKDTLQPTRLIVATVLLMMLSVSSMLVVGLASNFESPMPVRPAAHALSHPVGSSQGIQMGALRARLTRLVTYFARSG